MSVAHEEADISINKRRLEIVNRHAHASKVSPYTPYICTKRLNKSMCVYVFIYTQTRPKNPENTHAKDTSRICVQGDNLERSTLQSDC